MLHSITGNWVYYDDTTYMEEYWSEIVENNLTGTFKLIKNGEVQFYEFMTITASGEDYFLKIKHFDKNFVGWENSDDYMEFKLIKSEQKVLEFHSTSEENTTLIYNFEENQLIVKLIKKFKISSKFVFRKN
jgi:hypothetical protein